VHTTHVLDWCNCSAIWSSRYRFLRYARTSNRNTSSSSPPLSPFFFIDIPLFFFLLFPPRSLMHVRERGETRSNEPDIDRAHPSRTSHDNVKMTLKWIGNDWKMTFNDHSEVTLTSFWHYNDLLVLLGSERPYLIVYIISSLFSV